MDNPLDSILSDPTVTEIMIDGPDRVYVTKQGSDEKFISVESPFASRVHLTQWVQDLVATVGRKADEANAIVDIRLSDGSRVHVVMPPIAPEGPVVNIRKVWERFLTLEELIGYGSMDQKQADFLRACVEAGLNICVAGGTGSGKTTVANLLLNWIPEDERVILIENAVFMQMYDHPHFVRLESRPGNPQGEGEVTIRDLVISALRMRPDRIVLGEARSSEMMDLLQAMNTGHDGSLFTMHATTPRDALARLEVMASMFDPGIPLRSIREQMANAIDVIMVQNRLRDGTRKITSITEVTGFENDLITMADIFEFKQTDYVDDKIVGHFTPTGYIPKFMSVLRDSGFDVDLKDFFAPVDA